MNDNFYTIKDLAQLSKKYGYSGKYTSTIRGMIKRFNIRHSKTIIEKKYKQPTKVYSEAVYRFFEIFFDLEVKKCQCLGKAVAYRKLQKEAIKELK